MYSVKQLKMRLILAAVCCLQGAVMAQVRYTLKPFAELKGAYDSSIPLPDTANDSVFRDTASVVTSVNAGVQANVQLGRPCLVQAGYEFCGEMYSGYAAGNWQRHEVSISGRYIVSPRLLIKLTGSGNLDVSADEFRKAQGGTGTAGASYMFPRQIFGELSYGVETGWYPDLTLRGDHRYDYTEHTLSATAKKYLPGNATLTGEARYGLKLFSDAPVDTLGTSEEDRTLTIKTGYLKMFGQKAIVKAIGDASFGESNDTLFAYNDFQVSGVFSYALRKNVLAQVLCKYKQAYYPRRYENGVHQTDNRYIGSLDVTWTIRKIYTLGASWYVQRNDSNWESEDYLRQIVSLSAGVKY
jgi:hypothetical protein